MNCIPLSTACSPSRRPAPPTSIWRAAPTSARSYCGCKYVGQVCNLLFSEAGYKPAPRIELIGFPISGIATLHGHHRQSSNAHAKEKRGEWIPAHTAARGTPGVLRRVRHRGGRVLCALAGTIPGLFSGPGDFRSQALGLPCDGPDDAASRLLPAARTFRGTALIH